MPVHNGNNTSKEIIKIAINRFKQNGKATNSEKIKAQEIENNSFILSYFRGLSVG